MHTTNIRTLCVLLLLAAAGITATAEDKVLCVGNSFTFVNDAHLRLAELAESQGRDIKVKAVFEGGYTFRRHLCNDKTLKALSGGPYDYVFLQDQSQTPAYLAESPKRCRLVLRDAKELADRVRIYSRDAKIWIEQTWAYEKDNFGSFGSWENFDRMLRRGAKKMARKSHASVSPIGDAFALCRQERPDISLYKDDRHHQSEAGAYLKACVNYLLIYGEPFNAEATACGLDAEQAAYLRHAAERIVLKLKD